MIPPAGPGRPYQPIFRASLDSILRKHAPPDFSEANRFHLACFFVLVLFSFSSFGSFSVPW